MSDPIDPTQLRHQLRARQRQARWLKRAAAVGLALLAIGWLLLLLSRSPLPLGGV